MSWEWEEGAWPDLELIQATISIEQIGCPWARNIHKHPCYNRVFWSIYNEGLKTPLLVRPWVQQMTGMHTPNTDSCGNRFDAQPSPRYNFPPQFELVLGNMRYCALYTQGYKTVPVLYLPDDEHEIPVEELWNKYHPYFEGNWYDHPDHQMPNKYITGFDIGN